MVADLKYFDGTLAKIDRIPPEVRNLYATAFEIDPHRGWSRRARGGRSGSTRRSR